MAMTLLTFTIASSPWGEAWRHLWETPFRVEIGPYTMGMSIHGWVNEGLMALFFLLVGLELKREIMVGELASLRNAALPVAGAIGGMLAPAAVYLIFNPSAPARMGWGVPIATDIAFAVGILVLLAWRIPRSAAANIEGSNGPLSIARMNTIAEALEKASSSVQSPQQRMEHLLAPWVTFGVIPLFAMANAGLDILAIPIEEVIMQPITIGVVLGLVLGKFCGISGFAWLAVKLGFAKLPSGVKWRHIMGVSWLGGIGFTMSLFIGQLAFADTPSLFEEARLGIIMASTISAFIGLSWLYLSAKKTAVNSGLHPPPFR